MVDEFYYSVKDTVHLFSCLCCPIMCL